MTLVDLFIYQTHDGDSSPGATDEENSSSRTWCRIITKGCSKKSTRSVSSDSLSGCEEPVQSARNNRSPDKLDQSQDSGYELKSTKRAEAEETESRTWFSFIIGVDNLRNVTIFLSANDGRGKDSFYA